jgi:hypothetical protein
MGREEGGREAEGGETEGDRWREIDRIEIGIKKEKERLRER